MTDHQPLIDRLESGERSNALDMAIEIAMFVPDAMHSKVRSNDAGTKLGSVSV